MLKERPCLYDVKFIMVTSEIIIANNANKNLLGTGIPTQFCPSLSMSSDLPMFGNYTFSKRASLALIQVIRTKTNSCHSIQVCPVFQPLRSASGSKRLRVMPTNLMD